MRKRGAAADNVIDDPRKIARISGIVAVSAAEPGQLAYPVETEAGYRGALSYLFEFSLRGRMFSRNLLSDVADAALDMTVSGLESAIRDGMKDLQANGRLRGRQEPRFEVMSDYPIEDEPLFGGWEQESAVAFNNPVSSIEVSIRTRGRRRVYRSGENLEFLVRSSRPGYLYLLVFSENRKASCLFPNRDDPDNRIDDGNTTLREIDVTSIRSRTPTARDVVIAVVSRRRLALCEKVYSTWDELLRKIDLRSSHAELRSRSMRGIGVRPTPGAPGHRPRPRPRPEQDWQTASLVLETRR